MAFGDAKTLGIFLICLGIWFLPLTWALYVKYERQRKIQDDASVPLGAFLAISAAGLAARLWYEYNKRTGASMGSVSSPDYESTPE